MVLQIYIFLPNSPTGPIESSSRDVCPLMSPFHVDRFERALKTRSRSGLHTWKGHAWEVFNQWTGALVNGHIEPQRQGVLPDCSREWSTRERCIYGPHRRALKTRSFSGLNYKKEKKYLRYQLRYLVSPVCGIFCFVLFVQFFFYI